MIERARQADILTAAQRFGALKRVGASEYAGPCPVCGGKDRFSVNIEKQLWNCRGCGKGGDVIGLAQHAGGTTFAEAVAALSGETRASFKPPPRKRDPGADDDDVRRRRKTACWLWGQRTPLAGSIAETYLRKARGYEGPLPATLGFLKPFKGYAPSLIAAFAMPEEAEPGVLRAPLDVDAVQLIALKSDGSNKAAVEIQKRTIGAHKGVPIVVAPANDLLAISIHEGVEDALSAHEATVVDAGLPLRPARFWSSTSASLCLFRSSILRWLCRSVTLGLFWLRRSMASSKAVTAFASSSSVAVRVARIWVAESIRNSMVCGICRNFRARIALVRRHPSSKRSSPTFPPGRERRRRRQRSSNGSLSEKRKASRSTPRPLKSTGTTRKPWTRTACTMNGNCPKSSIRSVANISSALLEATFGFGSEPEHLRYAFELVGQSCTAIITNTPHNTKEACAIVKNMIDQVEGQDVDTAAALFRSIWGAEPGRLTYLNRPSFHGEILCCWRPRWIEGSEGSPMHAYTWYVWRKTPRSGPSLKVRIGKGELISEANQQNAFPVPRRVSASNSVQAGLRAAQDALHNFGEREEWRQWI
jgi:hypothetical protein